MSQSRAQEATVEASGWPPAEPSPTEVLLVDRFDYRELRETLEAVVASMVATTQGMTKEIECRPNSD